MKATVSFLVTLALLATACGSSRVAKGKHPTGKGDGVEMACVLNAPALWPREPVPPQCPDRARSTPRFDATPCGKHVAVPAQSRRWEVPVDLEPSAELSSRLARVAVSYSVDCRDEWRELAMNGKGGGFGANLPCGFVIGDTVVNQDPLIARYFIRGYDSAGNAICGEGSPETPFVVPLVDCDPKRESAYAEKGTNSCGCPPWGPMCDYAGCWVPFDEEICSEPVPVNEVGVERCNPDYCGGKALPGEW
jgi:hypothetical protein